MQNTCWNTVQGRYFNTVNTLSAACDAALLQEALAECKRYDALLSKTVVGSDVWRISHAQGAYVRVSEDTRRILQCAKTVYDASGGAFNPAVAPVVALWRMTSEQPVLPDPSSIERALALADFSNVVLDERGVCLPANVSLDLGGIAKGYIADRVADFLRERGVESALLNLGGNIVTVGRKPEGGSWHIGLQTPGGKRGESAWASVLCDDASVVTSGVYERCCVIDGKRYHHILDPRTGRPVENGLLSVSAVGKDSMLADALTTAMFVLGDERGLALSETFDVQAVFLRADGLVRYRAGMPIRLLGAS